MKKFWFNAGLEPTNSCFSDLALTTRSSGSAKVAKIEKFVELFGLVQVNPKKADKKV